MEDPTGVAQVVVLVKLNNGDMHEVVAPKKVMLVLLEDVANADVSGKLRLSKKKLEGIDIKEVKNT